MPKSTIYGQLYEISESDKYDFASLIGKVNVDDSALKRHVDAAVQVEIQKQGDLAKTVTAAVLAALSNETIRKAQNGANNSSTNAAISADAAEKAKIDAERAKLAEEKARLEAEKAKAEAEKAKLAPTPTPTPTPNDDNGTDFLKDLTDGL